MAELVGLTRSSLLDRILRYLEVMLPTPKEIINISSCLGSTKSRETFLRCLWLAVGDPGAEDEDAKGFSSAATSARLSGAERLEVTTILEEGFGVSLEKSQHGLLEARTCSSCGSGFPLDSG